METKEAITFCKAYAGLCGGWSIEMPKEDEFKFKQIINLLQRGEKYKAIVNELEKANDKGVVRLKE